MNISDQESAAYHLSQSQTKVATKHRNHKFKMFFAGLVFATISFIATHYLVSPPIYIKVLEVISLSSLLLSGLFLLFQLSEYNFFNNRFMTNILNILIWTMFIIGMSLMVIDRSIIMFLTN